MPECTKAHLQQSIISKFFLGGPLDVHFPGEKKEKGNGKGGLGTGRKKGKGT